MDRYKEGLRSTFEMEKCLREVVFEVMTRLSIDDEEPNPATVSTNTNDPSTGTGPTAEPQDRQQAEMRSLRKKYFKHEFRRTVRLLFACAARDLNDSALD